MSLKLQGLDVELQPFSEEERNSEYAENTGAVDPSAFKRVIEKSSDEALVQVWNEWMSDLFSHRTKSQSQGTPVFDTTEVTRDGLSLTVARKQSFGRSERPVLKRSTEFTEQGRFVGKSVCLQRAIDTEKDPKDIAEEVPFDIFPSEIWRVREYVDKHGALWMCDPSNPTHQRTPLTTEAPLSGLLYIMYTLDEQNQVRPKYIGVSRKEGGDGSLNWNFKNILQDSVFCRWGYGRGQHLGELSRCIFTDAYDTTKPKYQSWADDLFVDNTQLLREQVYVEPLAWWGEGLLQSEENLIRLASELFPDDVLNIIHNDAIQKPTH